MTRSQTRWVVVAVAVAVAALLYQQCRPEPPQVFGALIADSISEPDPQATALFGAHAAAKNYVDTVYTSGRCSMTRVGPTTFITAAHCAGGNDVRLKSPTKTVTLLCDLYGEGIDPYSDLALCYGNKESDLPASSYFETVSFDERMVERYRLALLAGFGGRAGTFGLGIVMIWKPPGAAAPIETIGAQAEPADSGGPVFSVEGGHRRLVGVISSQATTDPLTSFSVSLKFHESTLRKWVNNLREICGVGSTNSKCQ